MKYYKIMKISISQLCKKKKKNYGKIFLHVLQKSTSKIACHCHFVEHNSARLANENKLKKYLDIGDKIYHKSYQQNKFIEEK